MGLHIAIVRGGCEAWPGSAAVVFVPGTLPLPLFPRLQQARRGRGEGRRGWKDGCALITPGTITHGSGRLLSCGAIGVRVFWVTHTHTHAPPPPPPLPESAISGDVNALTSCVCQLDLTQTHTQGCVNRWRKKGTKRTVFPNGICNIRQVWR